MGEQIEMKKLSSIIALLLALVLLLASCGKGNKFEAEGTGFVDKKTKVTYKFAPLCYEPISLEEEIYGSDGELEFHEITGRDPRKWLGEASGGVFYSDDITLPTLDRMAITRVEICAAGNQIFVRDTITDFAEISELIGEYMNAEAISNPNNSALVFYKLRFADHTIGVYYCVEFLRFSADYVVTSGGVEKNYGKDFLYNRSEDRFVKAPEFLSERIDALLGVGESAE